MAHILSVRGKKPLIPVSCWIAPTAVVAGDVEMGEDCTVWFGAVVRGDVNSIRIGNRVNIQDGAIIHCTYQKADTYIGDMVTVGHRAVLHGCHIEDLVLVGMGAVVLDGARVESGVVIAAGAVVVEGAHLRSGYVYAGVPAKPVKQIDAKALKEELRALADRYVMYARWYGGEGHHTGGA